MSKYNIGDKFIIEIDDIIENEISHVGPYYKIKGFNNFVIDEDHLNTLGVCEDSPELINWSRIAIDTPILVRNHEDKEWYRRHFATYAHGKVYAWDDGKTSWSMKDIRVSDHKVLMSPWDFAKLIEE